MTADHSHEYRPTQLDGFQSQLQTLAQPHAFPPDVGATGSPIIVIQTHASAVLLTETHAYKIKKPVNFGFLDYSTPDRRRQQCIEEYRVNQALAPGVYLGVAPILNDSGDHGDHGSHWLFGPTYLPEDTPTTGSVLEGRVVADFAVVMRRLPESQTLASLVTRNRADAPLLQQIARHMASFHASAHLESEEAGVRAIDGTLRNVLQTVDQSRAHIGITVSEESYEAISTFLRTFIQRRRVLLDARAHDGWARDCHGDLRAEHVYVVPGDGEVGARKPEILIVDRIEFNPQFRFGDVAGEIMFLAAELEAAGRADLSRAFTVAYVQVTGDRGLLEVAPCYLVYRALVRGHVRSLYAAQPGIDAVSRSSAREEAGRMFDLATQYSATPTQPTLSLIGGITGSGKSTLAQALSQELGWTLISSDVTRKQLAGLEPFAPTPQEALQSLYTPSWDRRVYQRLRDEAARLLEHGQSALVDATFASRARRRMLARLTADMGARAIFLECVCPRAVALARLEKRWQDKMRGASGNNPIFASDARPALYDRLATRWQPFDSAIESTLLHATVDTTWSQPRQIEHAFAHMGIPRLACHLAAPQFHDAS